MRAVRLVLTAQFRQQWRPWLVLSLLIAVTCGFVMAAATAGRRTASAFPRFVAGHGYDAIVYGATPIPGIARMPGVASVMPVVNVQAGRVICRCSEPVGSNFAVLEVPPAKLTRVVKLVAGRMPDQSAPDEVLASFTLAQDKGVRVGSVLTVPIYLPAGRGRPGNSPPQTPPYDRRTFRVVGIEAAENEFPSGQAPIYDIYTTRAFAHAENARAQPSTIYYLRLRHGPSDLARLDSSLRRFPIFTVAHLDGGAAAVQASIEPQAIGWWVLAGLAALVGLAAIGQAISRESAASASDYETLAALGLPRRDFVLLGVTRVAITGVFGGIAGVALAVGLSPLAPVGVARLAEPAIGLSADSLVLSVGMSATLLAIVLLAIWPAVASARVHRTAGRPHAAASQAHIARALAAASAPPTATVGIRHAIERSADRYRVPVAAALTGMIMAVTALCATAIFGASLSHLLTSPSLYGDPFQVYFTQSGAAGQGIFTGNLLSTLKNDPSVDRVTLAAGPEITINRARVRAIAETAIRGAPLLSLVDGRLPHANRDIALGTTTMRQTGSHVGSTVHVTVTAASGATRTAAFVVVGRVVFPSDFGTGGLGTGAALTVNGYLDARCGSGTGQAACRRTTNKETEYLLLAHLVPGQAGHAALTMYLRRYSSQAARSAIPTALVNFGVSVDFPLILGVLLALFGAASLVHVLTVSVARRHREASILKALGFVRYQVAAVVCWQAATLAFAGVLVGAPLGVAAGRIAWRTFAANVGVVPAPIAPVRLLTLLAAGTIAAATALAIVPALLAARSRPGEQLRAL